MKNINWAVLGTGVIANEMAVALKKNGKNIYAVGNRTHEKAVIFARKIWHRTKSMRITMKCSPTRMLM